MRVKNDDTQIRVNRENLNALKRKQHLMLMTLELKWEKFRNLDGEIIKCLILFKEGRIDNILWRDALDLFLYWSFRKVYRLLYFIVSN
jgi:hypothetical protein